MDKLSFASRAVHGCQGHDPHTGALSFPIYQTSTYVNANDDWPYCYSRVQNPTREELEKTIALLEEGTHGFAFSSGLAAVLACFSLTKTGDHILISDDVYGGTYRLIEQIWRRYNVDFTYVDMGDLAAVKAAFRPETVMVFLETPTNPMMKVADIAAVSAVAKERGVVCVVDNTFLTPYYQRPIPLGADIVIHSATKFLAGHHDTTAGLIVTQGEDLAEKMRLYLKTEGTGLAPFDSWLTLRGIKTLALRMDKHQENAVAAAEFLQNHPKVEKVYFVGLPEHPSYDISCRQASGFGGMLSFSLKSGAGVDKVLRGGDMILFAESLGGVETLITYPMTMTHASIPKEVREKQGITDRLLRLSVGIEDTGDILRDLEKMLSQNG
ncbi:MAG: PLP-dependent aspartate aminotransferase family protein [Oscillospiraceae bacterium]|jgi:cystathionine gamma-synthase|nr:PLP-dependent aspartate aminotransferase family protein [Oscillospiraceae bacterium]